MVFKQTVYKMYGFRLRAQAIGYFIMGLFLFIGGIALAIAAKAWWTVAISLFGILLMLWSRLLWKRSWSLVQGKWKEEQL